jgi:hypothetical protein
MDKYLRDYDALYKKTQKVDSLWRISLKMSMFISDKITGNWRFGKTDRA